jgi:hypothetical protein
MMEELAQALVSVLSSPNTDDSNLEAANIVDVIDNLARSIRYAAETVAEAINNHAAKQDGLDEAVRALADSLDK